MVVESNLSLCIALNQIPVLEKNCKRLFVKEVDLVVLVAVIPLSGYQRRYQNSLLYQYFV